MHSQGGGRDDDGAMATDHGVKRKSRGRSLSSDDEYAPRSMSEDQLRAERLERNRLAAQASRRRKKEAAEHMQQRFAQLEEENKALKVENAVLRQQLVELQAQQQATGLSPLVASSQGAAVASTDKGGLYTDTGAATNDNDHGSRCSDGMRPAATGLSHLTASSQGAAVASTDNGGLYTDTHAPTNDNGHGNRCDDGPRPAAVPRTSLSMKDLLS